MSGASRPSRSCSRGTIEVSPHNPAGPMSTAASLHAAAIYPDAVRTLEYSFDQAQTRRRTGERIDNGVLLLNDKPGGGSSRPPDYFASARDGLGSTSGPFSAAKAFTMASTVRLSVTDHAARSASRLTCSAVRRITLGLFSPNVA